jgi:hypothetical protein
MVQDFARVLREQIRKDMNNYADDLAGGICRNFDEYQKLCGVIQGLAQAERYIIDLVQKLENSDE